MSAPGNVRRLKSGAKDDWRTPPTLFKAIQRRLNGIRFEFDLAADQYNHLCDRWYSEEDDALLLPWPEDQWSWCNPPYSLTKEFVARAIYESNFCPSVLLVPAASDTRWWAQAFESADVTLLLTGRVSFHNPVTNQPVSGNTTGSTIFVFGGLFAKSVEIWDWKKDL